MKQGEHKTQLITLNDFIFENLNNELMKTLKFMRDNKTAVFNETNINQVYSNYVRGLTHTYADMLCDIDNIPDEETNTEEVL